MKYVVSTFYHFVDLPDFEDIRESLRTEGRRLKLGGAILLASEGINATVAGSREGIDDLYKWLRSDQRFSDMQVKESPCDRIPFKRLTVRLKPEIVNSRIDNLDRSDLDDTYVNSQEWDELLEDPEVLVLDTRNDFEVRMGAFKHAVNPEIEKFSELPKWTEKNLDPEKTPKVAMYCTGGIRCEKASAYYKQQGFKVFQLHGGILKYFEETKNKKENWHGDCFVFDHRIGVDADLNPTYTWICCYCQEVLEEQYDACPHCQRNLTYWWQRYT